jgi:hypothetical protein
MGPAQRGGAAPCLYRGGRRSIGFGQRGLGCHRQGCCRRDDPRRFQGGGGEKVVRGLGQRGASRVATIFRANVQSAYSAGRYRQLSETAQTRPYWRFSAVLDNRTSSECRSLHGGVLRHDDSFWDRNRPCGTSTAGAASPRSPGRRPRRGALSGARPRRTRRRGLG